MVTLIFLPAVPYSDNPSFLLPVNQPPARATSACGFRRHAISDDSAPTAPQHADHSLLRAIAKIGPRAYCRGYVELRPVTVKRT